MYIVDTDVAIEYLKGNEEVVASLKSINDRYLTTVSIAELYYGAYLAVNPQKHFEALADFFKDLDFLTLDMGSSRMFGKIKSRLKKKGILIGDADIFIASIALIFDFFLITRNTKDFEKIEGLKLLRI